MLKDQILGWLRAGIVLTGTTVPLAVYADEPANAPVIVTATPNAVIAPAEVTATIVIDDAAETEAEPGYWIGLQLEMVTETLKSQLHLEQGVVVVQVFPDSPAAKAELKEHDIVTRVGDTVIKEASELQKAVADNKDKEITVTVVRGGKTMTVKVTPAKRPAQVLSQDKAHVETAQAWDQAVPANVSKHIEEAMKALQKAQSGEKRALGMYFVHPGVVSDGTLQLHRHLIGEHKTPENLTVTIHKDSGQPAKYVVKSDGKTYEVTEDKINDLPEGVRGTIKQILHKDEYTFRLAPSTATPQTQHRTVIAVAPQAGARAPVAVTIPAVPGVPGVAAAPGVWTTTTPVPARVHAMRVEGGSHVDQKLDTILQKLDQLGGQKIDQLQRELKQLKAEVEELRKKGDSK